MEQILAISRIENKYHEIEIYTEDDFWNVVYEEAEELDAENMNFVQRQQHLGIILALQMYSS